MSKLAILKLGYQSFVLPPKANIAAILTALQAAQQVDYTYLPEGGGKVFFPSTRSHADEIGIDYIDRSQLRDSEPGKIPKPKPVNPPLTLTNGNLLPLSSHATQR